jgi:hypothetical protein
MSLSRKPVIIIVHGAWHRPLHYINVVSSLKDLGYTVEIPALATSGWEETVTEKTLDDDVDIIRRSMMPHLEAGEEIVMVCHSFGGIPGTDSVVGESVQERKAKGLEGGIKAVVFIAAFASPQGGLSLFDIVGIKDESQIPSWWSFEVRTFRLVRITSSEILTS